MHAHQDPCRLWGPSPSYMYTKTNSIKSWSVCFQLMTSSWLAGYLISSTKIDDDNGCPAGNAQLTSLRYLSHPSSVWLVGSMQIEIDTTWSLIHCPTILHESVNIWWHTACQLYLTMFISSFRFGPHSIIKVLDLPIPAMIIQRQTHQRETKTTTTYVEPRVWQPRLFS